MSSTADERSRSLSNLGLPRTDWESMFWAVFASSEDPMAIVDVAHIGGRLVILVLLMADGERDGTAGSDSPPAPLTPRELEIIGRIALGATSREIGDDLFVTTETRTRAHLAGNLLRMRYGPTTRALAQWRSMTSTATGSRDARVGTFVWTPSTGVLRSCASLPSLLDLDAHHSPAHRYSRSRASSQSSNCDPQAGSRSATR